MSERTISRMSFGVGSIRKRIRLLLVGSLTGAVAGMGSFMYIKKFFLPWGIQEAVPFALIALAGAYTHFLARDLADSISLSLVAVVVGFAVHVGAWVAPLWILPYPPIARGILLPKMAGEALTGAIFVYLLTFYGSYFAAVILWGYLDP